MADILNDAALSDGRETQNAWQPIETAPKGGDHILLSGTQEPHAGIHFHGPVVFSGYWDRVDGSWCSTGSTWTGPFYQATHWMPLPEPPKEG